MAESLSSNLLFELEKTNHLFTRWATQQVDWIESTDLNYERSVEECQCTIQALQHTTEDLEALRADQEQIKLEQSRDVQLYEDHIRRIIELKKNLELKKDELDFEERAEQAKVEKVLQQNSKVRAEREAQINELAKGVRLYSLLGLEFQKADRNIMKFIFTQIDKSDPAKEFTFQMFVDESDQYRLVDTLPALDVTASQRLISALNGDNDIGKFVCNMRKLFVAVSVMSARL